MQSDLASVLGIPGTDLAASCKSSAINKWAKYKPVRYPNVDTTAGWDRSNNRWGSGAIWWKANDGLCGFSTVVASEFGDPTNSNSFAYKLIHGQLGWTYNKPNGGSSAPYRLTDFACYYHDAIPPYGEIGATTIYIQQNGDAQIDWDVPYVDSYYNLKLTDIQPGGNSLSDFYLGIILYNGSQWNLYTSDVKFGAGQALSVVMHNMASKAGTWNLMPFFSRYQVNGQGTFDPGGTFISMADTQPVSVTLTTQGSNHFGSMPWGEWNQAGTAVTYEIDIINDTSTPHTYTGVRISIRGGSRYGNELGYVVLSNVTVAGHTTDTKAGTITANKSGYTSYWIVVHDQTTGSTIDDVYMQVEDYGGM
jgi:hypothetical protein